VRVGNSKNDAAQNITRGRIRVMGLAKVSIMCLLSVGATNLRLTDTHTQRHERLAAAGPAVPSSAANPAGAPSCAPNRAPVSPPPGLPANSRTPVPATARP
jgi:hypothetical protein